MIISAWLKTESGDNYSFLREVDDETEMMKYIRDAMDTELAFVYDYLVNCINGSSEAMTNLLREEINKLQSEEEYNV